MNKVLISVLGSDQPGIMAKVASIINQHNGNIENLSQTLLDNVFGALLMANLAEDDSAEKLEQSLQDQTRGMNLYIPGRRAKSVKPKCRNW